MSGSTEINEEMRLPGRDAIEAYISQDGMICLKQDDPCSPDPNVVVMLKNDVPTVVQWLQRLAVQLDQSEAD